MFLLFNFLKDTTVHKKMYYIYMDLVSSYIGDISSSLFEAQQKVLTSGVNLNDKTFSEILETQMQKILDETKQNMLNGAGVLSGINIGDYDGRIPEFELVQAPDLNAVKSISDNQNSAFENLPSENDYSASEVLTFFPSLFSSKPTMTENTLNSLYNFEKKNAANSYEKCSRNVITDLGEFVTDTIKLR